MFYVPKNQKWCSGDVTPTTIIDAGGGGVCAYYWPQCCLINIQFLYWKGVEGVGGHPEDNLLALGELLP